MLEIRFEGVSKQFPQGKLALKDISCSINSGEFLGILGLNGAGKSTFVRLLSGLLAQSSGEIEVFGLKRRPGEAAPWRHLIGLAPQEPNFSPFEPVEDALVAHGYLVGLRERETKLQIQELLEALKLADKRKAAIGSLSGGMRRRLALARSLLGNPPILILDEPSAGVDFEAKHAVWDRLRMLHRGGTTVLLTSHYLEEVEILCGQILLLEGGQVKFKGSFTELHQQYLGEERWELKVRSTRSNPKAFPKAFRAQTQGGSQWQLSAQLSAGQSAAGLSQVLEDLGYELLEATRPEFTLKDLIEKRALKRLSGPEWHKSGVGG